MKTMTSLFTLDASTSESTLNFQSEISSMMHGLGDNPNPNPATVTLVETIVHQQLRSIIQEASEHSKLRGSKIISNVDVIYLLRNNKLKFKRLYEYQKNLEAIQEKNKLLGLVTSSEGLPVLDDDKDVAMKKSKSHSQVIRELDEADEVSLIKFDEIKYLRDLRANKLSESLTLEKYNAYHKARCASFRSASTNRFKEYSKLHQWINPNNEHKLLHCALDILRYLAYETVAELVDTVFILRQDIKRKNNDPFSKLDGGNFCNPISLSNAVYIKSGYEGVSPISVAEIREVIRRFFAPRIGPRGLFYRNMSQELPVKYIAF